MRTVRATWYEVWFKKSYGARLADRFVNQRGAKKAIKETREKQIAAGYKPQDAILMIADSITTIDDDGETVFNTTTYARA